MAGVGTTIGSSPIASVNSFGTPYSPPLRIGGLIKGNKRPRPNAISAFFANRATEQALKILVDIEANSSNVMGQYVGYDIDTQRVHLPTMGVAEFGFAYSKEKIGSPDWEEIIQRQAMEQLYAATLDSARLMGNYTANIAKQMELAHGRMDALTEKACCDLVLTGIHDTVMYSPRGDARPMRWALGRTILQNPGGIVSTASTNAANNTAAVRALNTASIIGTGVTVNGATYAYSGQVPDMVPQTDLTTLFANTSTAVGGGLSWDSVDGATGTSVAGVLMDVALPSPVKTVFRMLKISGWRSGGYAIVMSNDAYAWYINDLNKNYLVQANVLNSVIDDRRFDLEFAAYVTQNDGLTFRRWLDTGIAAHDGTGMLGANNLDVVNSGLSQLTEGLGRLPIFTYDAKYTNRATGILEPFWNNGFVAVMPNPDFGNIRYGIIRHLNAKFQAVPRWVNYWLNPQTGFEEWELHSAPAYFHSDPNAMIVWKVCSTFPSTVAGGISGAWN